MAENVIPNRLFRVAGEWPDRDAYVGDPNDVVKVRRKTGTGVAVLFESPTQQGMPACDCHENFSHPIVHEGDIILMLRSEVQGYWREEDGVWNAGRSDFEIVPEETVVPPAKRARAERAQPAPVYDTVGVLNGQKGTE